MKHDRSLSHFQTRASVTLKLGTTCTIKGHHFDSPDLTSSTATTGVRAGVDVATLLAAAQRPCPSPRRGCCISNPAYISYMGHGEFATA